MDTTPAKTFGRLLSVACALALVAGSLLGQAKPASALQLHKCWGHWGCLIHGAWLERIGHVDVDDWRVVRIDGTRYIYHD